MYFFRSNFLRTSAFSFCISTLCVFNSFGADPDPLFPATDYKPDTDALPSVALFEPNFDFPSDVSDAAAAWQKIDFKTSPAQYGDAIFSELWNAYETTVNPVETSSASRDSSDTASGWFHMPWRHVGRDGREAIAGLNRTFPFFSGRLARDQRTPYQNWTQSLYNTAAASALASIWNENDGPVISSGFEFPEGSVMAQFVFTEAPTRYVDFWEDAPEIQAHIFASQRSSRREVKTLRLIEIHFAAKDTRSPVGWVFGSFRYENDGTSSPSSDRFPLMTLTWGNLLEGGSDDESWIRSDIQNRPRSMGEKGYYIGLTKDTRSSCVACHATGQNPRLSAMVPPETIPERLRERWFLNLPPGTGFDGAARSTDYSMGLSLAVEAYREAHPEERGSDRTPADRWTRPPTPMLIQSNPDES